MPQDISIVAMLPRMALAALFGAAVGWERESIDKLAGLRTHMLVALGASCFTLSGMRLFHDQSGDSVP